LSASGRGSGAALEHLEQRLDRLEQVPVLVAHHVGVPYKAIESRMPNGLVQPWPPHPPIPSSCCARSSTTYAAHGAELAIKDEAGKPSVVRAALKAFEQRGARYCFPAGQRPSTGVALEEGNGPWPVC
jgi:hypothetical protein